MNRIVWLDYGKAIAIYLVVLAHTALYKPAEAFVYTFHMPFFFFMSGYLFSFEKYPSYMQFAKKRFKQLIIPYIILNLLTYLLWFFILRKVGDDANETVGVLSPLMAALTVSPKAMVHDVPLWFLAALFLVENLYYLLYKNKRYSVVLTATLFLLAFLNTKYNPVRLPFCIDIAIVALLFYRLGCVLREKGDKIFKPYLFALSALVLVLAFVFNGKVAMHTNTYNNIFLFVAGGVAGCYFMSYICMILQNLCGERKFVKYIAKDTLLICAFHLIVFAGLKGAMLYIFKIDPSVLTGTVLPNVIFALLSMVICIVISIILDKLNLKKFLIPQS